MKSRTRTNKSRVLIALGKGIASTLAIELAMLFLHGGSEVKFAIIDGGEDWAAEAPLKQMSGHSALTSKHKPGWFYAGLRFDATVLVAPSNLTQQQLITATTADPVVEFILNSGNNYRILQNRPLLPDNHDDLLPRFVFNELPAQPLRLSQFFQKIFAETTAKIASLARLQNLSATITYAAPVQISAHTDSEPGWVKRLRLALINNGFKITAESGDADVLISAYDGPQVCPEGRLFHSLPTLEASSQTRLKMIFVSSGVADNLIEGTPDTVFIRRNPDSLTLFDCHGPRLLPDVTGQCCFARLADYIVTHLSRSDNTPHNRASRS